MMRSSMLIRGRTLPRLGLSPPGCDDGAAAARSMPLGLMLGGPFSPFSRAISSRCAATICRSAATSASNCTTSALSWVGFSALGSSGSGTRRLNRKTAAKRTGKCQPPQRRRLPVTSSTHLISQRPAMPGVLPVLPTQAPSCESRVNNNTVHLGWDGDKSASGKERRSPMARSVATLPAGSRLTDYISLGGIAKCFPLSRVNALLAATNRASLRQRDLPAPVVMYYVISLALYMGSSYREVLRCLLEGVQWLFGPSIRIKVAG